jgi:hypothetical protein
MSRSPVHPYLLIHRLVSALLLTAILLAGCASQAIPAPSSAREAPSADSSSFQSQTAAEQTTGGISNSTANSAQAAERIVVKNARLNIVVSDPSKSIDTISKMAQSMGGFVVNADMEQTQLDNGAKVPTASVTIRVPAERLDEALSQIKALSDRLPLSENIESKDVTSDYTDLQSRLRNLENTEAQLTKIMDSATSTEDVLSVYNRLVDVRQQIEVLKGQINYYDQSAALSSISVDLVANEAVQPLTIGGWQPVGVAKNAIQALINTLKFLANAAIWILILVIPVLVVLYIVFFLPLSLLWKWLRSRRRRKVAPPATTPPPPTPPVSPAT